MTAIARQLAPGVGLISVDKMPLPASEHLFSQPSPPLEKRNFHGSQKTNLRPHILLRKLLYGGARCWASINLKPTICACCGWHVKLGTVASKPAKYLAATGLQREPKLGD